jgi:hypothetical protein
MFGPTEVLGHRSYVGPVTSEEKHYLPHSEAAALEIGLPPGGRISKVDERKLRTPQAFLN